MASELTRREFVGTGVERAAMRVGNWKYLHDEGEEYLFDLATDPGEKTDLRAKRRDAFEALRQKYRTWNLHMLPNPR